MTSSRPLVWMSLTKQSGTDFMRVAWGPDVLKWALCSLPGTVELDWHLLLNTKIGMSATGTLCFSQMSAGSPCAHVTDVKGSGEAVENSMTSLVVGQWWYGEQSMWAELSGENSRSPLTWVFAPPLHRSKSQQTAPLISAPRSPTISSRSVKSWKGKSTRSKPAPRRVRHAAYIL